MSSVHSDQYADAIAHHSAIQQRDLTELSDEELERELAEFERRLRAWAPREESIPRAGAPTVSVEIPVFKGGWIMPCVESVLYQTSTRWCLSMRWDGGDTLSRRVLERVQTINHPKIDVSFGENRGIAYTRRFLTEHSHGEYILPLDDDDMLAPHAIEKFLRFARAKPWSGIVRARRDFVDAMGNRVNQAPWFPFEPRHYQFGMVQDVSNHCQPMLISRAAYRRTPGWQGFEEFRSAGEDCDIFLKVEEVAPIELLDEVLYHYRLNDRRTSLVITDRAAYEMWRSLADQAIARIGLPITRINDQPPFSYERRPRRRATCDDVDFVVFRAPGASLNDAAVEATVQCLKSSRIASEAIHVVRAPLEGAGARNDGFRATARPLICYIRAGIDVSAGVLTSLLDVMHERAADLVAPRIAAMDGTIRAGAAAFSGEYAPLAVGQHPLLDEHDRIAAGRWLPSSLLLVRREVVNAVGGFETGFSDAAADADFSLKARRRDFTCVYVGTAVATDHEPRVVDGATGDEVQWLGEKWKQYSELLEPLDFGADMANYRRLYEHAEALLHGGKTEQAISALRAVSVLNPNFSWAYHTLGDALYKLGRWEAAADAFRRAIELKEGVAWSHHHLGNSLAQLERWAEAASAYQHAIDLDPAVASAHSNLAGALLRLDRLAEGIAAYEEAIRLEPQHFWAHYGHGDALAKSERWAEAVLAYERAIAIDPDVFWAHFNLAETLTRLKRWEQAIAAFQRAIDIDPSNAQGHWRQGLAWIELHRKDDGVRAFERAVAVNPQDAAGHAALGGVLSQLNRWEEATESYQRAIDLAPTVAAYRTSVGHAWMRLESYDAAVIAYQRVVDIQPDAPTAYVDLANAQCKLHRWQEAIANYERAIELDPRSFWAHYYCGCALLKQMRPEEAAAAFIRAIGIDDGFCWAHHYLGESFARLDRNPEAEAAFRRALDLEPGLFWAWCNLGDVLVKSQRWEEARSAYERAIAGWSDFSVAHHNLGDVLCRLGHVDDAISAYRRADAIKPPWTCRDVGPVTGAFERRMEDLSAEAASPQTAASPQNPRLLFVFDNDYGELTTAMYMVLGQAMASTTTLLLPPRLFINNNDTLAGRTRLYGSIEDIIDAVDRCQPDIVFLCSAYLFPVHNICTPERLQELVGILTARGCRVVTTDPFLGLLSRLGTTTRISVDIPPHASAKELRVKQEQEVRLVDHFSKAEKVLRDLDHLYPARPAASGEVTGGEKPRAISFFNTALVLDEAVAAKEAGLPGSPPQWVFVLASRDYEVQASYMGKERFAELLARKLNETACAGRHPVLVAPFSCVNALIAHMEEHRGPAIAAGVTLMTFCSFKRFAALLLTAEYVFYWNALSHSMFLRLFNERPTFLFDRGHLVRNVTPLYERIVEWYYQGWDPVYLDQEQELTLEALAGPAQVYRTGARQIRASFRRAPAPPRLVAQIGMAERSGHVVL